MTLVDSPIWFDHLCRNDVIPAGLLNNGRVLAHPFIIGELALGHLRQRALILDMLSKLPQAIVAHDTEVLRFIEPHVLSGQCSSLLMQNSEHKTP